MYVIKFGGAIITDKGEPYTPNLDNMRRVGRSLMKLRGDIILAHGAGSFGHTAVKEKGLGKDGFCFTRSVMEELNHIFVKELLNAGLNVISMQTSALFTCDGGRINDFNSTPIDFCLKNKLIPVMYGDVVFDEEKGWVVLSADQIVTFLAERYDGEFIFVSDVKGLYTDDPKKKDAELIPFVKDVKKYLKYAKEVGDVSGGMLGKLKEIASHSSNGWLLDLENFEKFCSGDEFEGTRFENR